MTTATTQLSLNPRTSGSRGRIWRQKLLLTTVTLIGAIVFLWPVFVMIGTTFNSIDAPMNP